jgi:hypothetical protein
MRFLKEAYKYYKQLKIEDKQRKRLINTDLDYSYLQWMLDKAEENPDLMIRVTLKDGKKIEMLSKKKKNATSIFDYINGEDDVLEIN